MSIPPHTMKINLPELIRIEVTKQNSFFRPHSFYIRRFVGNKLVGEGWVRKGDVIHIDVILDGEL